MVRGYFLEQYYIEYSLTYAIVVRPTQSWDSVTGRVRICANRQQVDDYTGHDGIHRKDRCVDMGNFDLAAATEFSWGVSKRQLKFAAWAGGRHFLGSYSLSNILYRATISDLKMERWNKYLGKYSEPNVQYAPKSPTRCCYRSKGAAST